MISHHDFTCVGKTVAQWLALPSQFPIITFFGRVRALVSAAPPANGALSDCLYLTYAESGLNCK